MDNIRTGSLVIGLLALAGGCAPSPQVTTQAQFTPADWAAACPPDSGWDDAGPPFRIHGNSYYVGTCGIAAVLITGSEGHVLIDGGTEKGGELIAANVERLGFKLSDVKILLHSHEHFDHVAGLASLQRRTGARLLASAPATPVLTSGITAAEDPQAGMHDPFPPARVDGTVTPGSPVRLGSLTLMPVATPGHTVGALSWQWQACERNECRTIVYADSLSPVSSDAYKFTDHPAYLDAYRAALSRLSALQCDIVVTPHPAASELYKRAAANRLADAPQCDEYAAGLSQRLDTRVAQERGR